MSLAALLFLNLACAPRHVATDPFAEALAAADRTWAGRGGAGTLDEAEHAYFVLLAERPESPEVSWRLARVAFSRAMAAPNEAARWHEVGREYALGCLGTGAASDVVVQAGDRVTPSLLEAGHAPPECLVYGAAHIVGLVRARGHGADLDLRDAEPLLAAAASGAPEAEVALREWTTGELQAWAGGASSEARAHLASAVAAEPGVRFYRRELEAAFPDSVGSLPEFVPAAAWAVENGG